MLERGGEICLIDPPKILIEGLDKLVFQSTRPARGATSKLNYEDNYYLTKKIEAALKQIDELAHAIRTSYHNAERLTHLAKKFQSLHQKIGERIRGM